MAYFIGPNVVRDGLIFHLDAGNTKSYPGTGEAWTDLTGNGNNGTFISGVTFDTGNCGNVVLDGTSYISIEDDPNLNLNVFTYAGWIKNTDDLLFWNRVASKKNSFSDLNGYEIALSTVSSTDLYIGGSSGDFAVISTINWVGTGWHELVVVFSGSTVIVYCDGIYKNQGVIASVVSNNRPLFLGKINSEATTQWIGGMANIRMYNRVLSQAEITQNFNALKGRFL